jgi:hypothetical protein
LLHGRVERIYEEGRNPDEFGKKRARGGIKWMGQTRRTEIPAACTSGGGEPERWLEGVT